MPALTLLFDNQKKRTYSVEKDRVLRIGRDDHNDIIIDESEVSSRHAVIEFDLDGYYITDIQSKNGTFVDGELVISRKLKDGNTISIGNHTLVFQYREGENRHNESDATVGHATMKLDTSFHRARLARSLAEIGEEREKTETRGILTFLENDKQPVVIDKPVITIGKAETCDIVVKGLLIGKIAAEIHHSGEAYYLKPVGGKIRPRVNYKPIKSETGLKDFDVIEIGTTRLQFHLR